MRPRAARIQLPQVEFVACAKFVPRVKATEPVSGWLPTFWTETDLGLSALVLSTSVEAKLNDGGCDD